MHKAWEFWLLLQHEHTFKCYVCFTLWDATISTTQTSCPQYLSHTHLHTLPSNFTMLCFLINFSCAWNPLEAISLFTKHPGTPVGAGEDDSCHNTCMKWFSYTTKAVLWLLVNICYIWAYVLLVYFWKWTILAGLRKLTVALPIVACTWAKKLG